jgi:hypothetical protein
MWRPCHQWFLFVYLLFCVSYIVYGDVTITSDEKPKGEALVSIQSFAFRLLKWKYGEVLQDLGLCSALMAFEQGNLYRATHARFSRFHPKWYLLQNSDLNLPQRLQSLNRESALCCLIRNTAPGCLWRPATRGTEELFLSRSPRHYQTRHVHPNYSSIALLNSIDVRTNFKEILLVLINLELGVNDMMISLIHLKTSLIILQCSCIGI